MSIYFLQFVSLLNKHKVRYALVGGWAVISKGYPRLTSDLDIFIEPTIVNAEKVLAAIVEFTGGFTTGRVVEDFCYEDNVVTLGQGTSAIDILTSVSGLTFEEVIQSATLYDEEGVQMPCIHINQLIENKEASGRPKDIADAAYLKQLREKGKQ